MDIELKFINYGSTLLVGCANLCDFDGIPSEIMPFIMRDTVLHEGRDLFREFCGQDHMFVSAGHNLGDKHFYYLLDAEQPVIEFICDRDFAATLARNKVSGLISPLGDQYFVRCYLGNHIPAQSDVQQIPMFCSMMHDIITNTKPFDGEAPNVLMSLAVLRGF